MLKVKVYGLWEMRLGLRNGQLHLCIARYDSYSLTQLLPGMRTAEDNYRLPILPLPEL